MSGSATSQLALRWALRTADECGYVVYAVHVWSPGTMADFVWHDARQLRQEAGSLLRHAIASARAATGSRAVVAAISLSGPVEPALVDIAAGAGLLVLGGRAARDRPDRFGAGYRSLPGNRIVVISDSDAAAHDGESAEYLAVRG